MRVKNDSGSSKVWVGQTIADQGTFDISFSDLFKWQDDDTVLADLSSGDLLIGDGVTYKSSGAEAINYLIKADTSPKDPANRQIVRTAATIDGWHYQLLSTEITTSKYQGFYNKDENGNDLGFVTHKIYDSNGTEITGSNNEANAVKTVLWIRPSHSYEVIGAVFGQNTSPSTDIRMWVTGLPGIYNIRFANGGINLKHCGDDVYQLADGRASKYLAYNAQAADANSFKITLTHGQGVQHTFQMHLEIFKAP